MAEMNRFLFLRHLRSEMSSHVVLSQHGRTTRAGRGLAFWFMPMNASVSEVPLDDRDQPILFQGRSADFQEVTTQGVITWRVANADLLAERVDFTLDLGTGRWARTPLEQVAQLLVELAQQEAWAYVSHNPVDTVLREGVSELRARLNTALRGSDALENLGIQVVTVRVSSVRPSAELEKALQTPAREEIQQSADKAMFERRARAVDQERAIAENELHNKIELARREEALIDREGSNQRRRVTEAAEAQRIRAESEASTSRIAESAAAEAVVVKAEARAAAARHAAAAEAERLAAVGEAKAGAERALVEAVADVPPHVLYALVAREFSGQLPSIEHLNIAPDLLGPALMRVSERLGGAA